MTLELPPLKQVQLDPISEAKLEGYWMGVAVCQPLIDQANADADRYYRIAARGGFGTNAEVERGFCFADLMAVSR